MRRLLTISKCLFVGGLALYGLIGITGCGVETNAAPFSVNPHRVDPYKNFKFRVKWDGQYIDGVSYISQLKRTTEVVLYREGADTNNLRPMPGRTTFDPIVLERGRTHDTAFEEWANLVWRFGQGPGAEMSLKHFRKDIIIELANEAGNVALAFHGFRCWPSDYTPVGHLSSSGRSSVATESLKIQCEAWERDTAVTEPEEQ